MKNTDINWNVINANNNNRSDTKVNIRDIGLGDQSNEYTNDYSDYIIPTAKDFSWNTGNPIGSNSSINLPENRSGYNTKLPGVDKNKWTFSRQMDENGMTYGGQGMDMFNVAQGAFNAYGNIQKLNLAKDTLAFNQEAFNKNYEAQRKITQSSFDWKRKAANDRNAGSGKAYNVTV
jgi:hypothetical protein